MFVVVSLPDNVTAFEYDGIVAVSVVTVEELHTAQTDFVVVLVNCVVADVEDARAAFQNVGEFRGMH